MDSTNPIHELLIDVQSQLASSVDNPRPLADAQQQLVRFAEAAQDASRPDLTEFAVLLSNLLQVLRDFWEADVPADDRHALLDFCRRSAAALERAVGDAAGQESLDGLRQQAQQQWGECLQVLGDTRVNTQEQDELWELPASSSPSVEGASGDRVADADASQIGLILRSLGKTTIADSEQYEDHQATAAPELFGGNASGSESTFCPSMGDGLPSDESARAILADPEIREAFMDDAQCGLGSIEAALLAYESDQSSRAPLQQVCRELHTLKGASASVGLEKLASFLHHVEDDLQAACDQGGAIDLQPIFQAVDAVRSQMNSCCDAPPPAPETVASQNTPAIAAANERFVDTSPATQDSVRVKAAQLDRLMDMLAELVMLRNRRESHVEQLKTVHSELVRCVSRLRAYEETDARTPVAASVSAGSGANRSVRKQRVSSLTEVANDLLELGGSLRELYEPVGDENMAISRFIRQFRQELIQLRRVPIGGLFQRLQRSIRDAARTEQKKIRLHLIGEDVGLESSLQQQLYEPLLHIVRNAVSHGIEAEEQRLAHGKQPTGTVTLEAHGGSNMLVITVRDDGRGLDYDALRRRGLEMGLIAADRAYSRPELARLIFHPGFSTRTSTSEISGRGVGMDVVQTVLERLHSWIEVDSVPGQGTSVRLLVPLHSVIEHVMVFRASGQDFAIPTQYVKYAGDPNACDTSEFPLHRLDHLFPTLPSPQAAQPQLLVLACEAEAEAKELFEKSPARSSGSGEQRFGLLVDEIVGPEEVVVRPLPALLAQQHLFSGVTLSGTGDIMLLFHSQELMRRGFLAVEDRLLRTPGKAAWGATDVSGDRRILVVDDSRSSRRTLIRSLQRFAREIDEAVDGVDALRRLKEQSYDLIFTDLEMPQMGGMDLLREVKNHPRHAGTPVIIVSSRGEEQFRQRARELGVTDYLTKPVSEPLVTQAMERFEQQQERQLV